MKVVIAGGGVAGLTAALSFARLGHDVQIFEQAEGFEQVGAGLQLSSNAMKVLQALDLQGQVLEVGDEPETLEVRSGMSGREIFSVSVGQTARTRYGAPYVHVYRPDLISVLEAAVSRSKGIGVQFGRRVAGYKSAPKGAVALLTCGQEVECDLLVAADGVRSTIRRQMTGGDAPRFTGCRAWRFIVPIDLVAEWFASPSAIVWCGPGRHVVTYRVAKGSMLNVVAVIEGGGPAPETWVEKGDLRQLSSGFKSWAEPVRAAISAAPDCHVWGLYDRDPLITWSDGRVVLIGDSAHPLPPFQAQGAAMAIEDAFFLSRCVDGSDGDVDGAIRSFVHPRRRRTKRILHSSRFNQRLFHLSYGPERWATYGLLRTVSAFSPAFLGSRQNWIYSHDTTQVPLNG